MAWNWSSDGTKLVITASTTPILQEYRFGLFIADVVTGNITPINIDREELRSYTDPQWSPNGLLIGVNTNPNENEIVNDLVIFDPEDETVKGNLSVERQQPDWLWSSTGEAILVNLPSAERIGIFYWKEDRLEKVSPPEQLKEGIESGEILITNLTW
jgi:hypothetical protein